MEHKTKTDLQAIAQRQVDDAQKYAEAREMAGKAELALNCILVASLSEIRGRKKNVGIEMAQLMVCEDNPEATNYYAIWKQNEATYKGLEKLIDARGGQIIMEQSLMKNEREGAKWG